MHKAIGFVDPSSNFMVMKALQGAKNQGVTTRSLLLPITKKVLKRICDAVSECATSRYEKVLYRSLFLLAYHACMRAGEIVHSNEKAHTIRLDQIERLQNDSKYRGFKILFKSYKHCRNATQVFHLLPEKDSTDCPVKALTKYLIHRGDKDGPLYICKNGKPISRTVLSAFLKQCLLEAGYDSKKYNTHSFRIGRATDLAKRKTPEAIIRATGRWKSSAFMKYIRPGHFSLPR